MESTKKSEGVAVYGQARECLNKACVIIIEEPVNGQKFCSMFCKDSHWAYVREEGKKVVNGNSKTHFSSMNSQKLQSMLFLLKDGAVHTSISIIQCTLDVAFNQTIQALRNLGHDIECEFIETNDNGRKVYGYQLIGECE